MDSGSCIYVNGQPMLQLRRTSGAYKPHPGNKVLAEGSYALIGIVKGLVILLLCVIELLTICLMGNTIDYIDI